MLKWSFRTKNDAARDLFKGRENKGAEPSKGAESHGARTKFRKLLRRRTTRRRRGSSSALLNLAPPPQGCQNQNLSATRDPNQVGFKEVVITGIKADITAEKSEEDAHKIEDNFHHNNGAGDFDANSRRHSVRERLLSESQDVLRQVTAEYVDLSRKMESYCRSMRKRKCSTELMTRDECIRRRFANVTKQAQDFMEESSSAAMISAYLEEGFAMLDGFSDACGGVTSTPMPSGRFVRPSASSMGAVSAISEFEIDDDDVFLTSDRLQSEKTKDDFKRKTSLDKICLQLVLPTKTDSPRVSRSLLKRPLESDLVSTASRPDDVIGVSHQFGATSFLPGTTAFSSPCGTFKRQKGIRTKRTRLRARRITSGAESRQFRWTSTREIIMQAMDKDRRKSTVC